MANLTLSIDDALLRRARIKALEDGTSVNAILREHLTQYVADVGPGEASAALLRLSDRLDSGSGPEGRTWTREQLYEEMLRRPGQPLS